MTIASNNPFPSVLVVEGTTPTSPASGDQRLFIDSVDHKLKRVNSSGTVTTIESAGGGSGNVTFSSAYASPPGSPASGDLWLPSDSILTARYNGASWDWRFGTFPITIPPTVSGFTAINSASGTDEAGTVYLPAAANASFNIRALVKTAPSTPYTITALILPQGHAANYNAVGLCWRDSSGGGIVYFACMYDSGASLTGLYSQKATSATAFSAGYTSVGVSIGEAIWLQITDDGTNRICRWSRNGTDFHQVHSVGRTDFLTANQVGIFAKSENASFPAALTLVSWKQT